MALPGEGFSSPCEVPANFFVEQNKMTMEIYLVQGLIGSKFSMMLIMRLSFKMLCNICDLERNNVGYTLLYEANVLKYYPRLASP